MEDSEATLEQAKIMRANASNSSVAFHAAPSDFSCAICCRDAIEENGWLEMTAFSCLDSYASCDVLVWPPLLHPLRFSIFTAENSRERRGAAYRLSWRQLLHPLR